MILNNFFIITFKPKHPIDFNGRRRFSIGAHQIGKYLGERNAEILKKKLEDWHGPKAGEKFEKKYPKYGRITVYAK